MVHIAQLPLRGIQIAFAAIVLGLSESLVHGQVINAAPGVTHVGSFNGAWGLFVAVIGIVAAFIEKIPVVVMLVLDAIAVLFWFADSIAMAVKLGVHSCSKTSYTHTNAVINAGIPDTLNSNVNYSRRCHMAQADDAFMFFGLVVFVGSLVLDLMAFRRRKAV